MAQLPVGELFPHPTIQQVVFQVRYPKLFFLAPRIGDLQLALMSQFPKSESAVQHAVFFAQGRNDDLARLLTEQKQNDVERIWKFENDNGVIIELKLDALTLVSTSHKSYRHTSNSFRQTIEFVLDQFLKIAPLPTFSRLGLRYVDDCPFPEGTSTCFHRYFNSALPTQRFPVENCSDLAISALHVHDSLSLRYTESIVSTENGHALRIDMDAFCENTDAKSVLETTDRLHSTIRSAFEMTVKEPVLDYMRTGQMK